MTPNPTTFLEQPILTDVDEQSRKFHYLLIRQPGSKKLVVHFTAFFGDWGDRKEFKTNYQGYFHRYRMLKDCGHNCLFLCDQFGATQNGTYYTGEKGDLFVERAMLRILKEQMTALGIRPDDIVMVGSSMGAFAALKFGLLLNVGSIVAICPHIDLDICAARQGRERHVAFIVPDGDPYAPHNFPITRKVRELLAQRNGVGLPVLFMHSCQDDHGVHDEQVLPLVKRWKQLGGKVYFDERVRGGHTSELCTKPLLLDAVDRLLAHEDLPVEKYQTRRVYAHPSQLWERRLWTEALRPALVRVKRWVRPKPPLS